MTVAAVDRFNDSSLRLAAAMNTTAKKMGDEEVARACRLDTAPTRRVETDEVSRSESEPVWPDRDVR